MMLSSSIQSHVISQVSTGGEIEPLGVLGRSLPLHFRASDETGGETMWLAVVGNAP